MKILNNKTVVILATMLLILSMSISLFPSTLAQIITNGKGTVQTSYPYIQVGPNPIGVGQTATIIMFVANPPVTSEDVKNWTLTVTTPSGVTSTLGPFVSDETGGTDTTYVPETIGNYTFQGFVAQQVLVDGVTWTAGQSSKVTLVVQSAPVTLGYYPVTALPTSWWQTPVTAENVQNWYAITGPWLGLGDIAFAFSGGFNNTQNNYNPYTEPVMSGHILWTKPWFTGGVVGGSAGATELSNFWSTSQYWPKYAPVVMNGVMYSTWFTTDTSNPHGIQAWNLFTGQSIFTINTTTTLICGMETFFKNPNMYGYVGPYLITEGYVPGVHGVNGTAYDLWDATNGDYDCCVINAPAEGFAAPFAGPEWGADANGNAIAWYVDNSVTGYPTLDLFNMTLALGMGLPYPFTFGWAPAQGGIFQWNAGIEWKAPIPTTVDGQTLNTPLAVDGETGNSVILTGGFTLGQWSGGLQQGYTYVAAMSSINGALLWIKNFTATDSAAFAPWTRTQMQIDDGLWINVNMDNDVIFTVNANSGTEAWTSTLPAGINTDGYDVFNMRTYNGPGILVCVGFGGDIWCLNDTTGKLIWETNTISILGSPGLETPYATWPLWTFLCDSIGSTNGADPVGYFAVGHEYNPPLFHGAQLIAINMTNGQPIWHELDFSVDSTEISYGVVLSYNAYDGQIYAFGKGPSQTTVTAPDIGVTTATPITITGTVMDISPGTKQSAVALNFPNGVPCVSDASESHYMEYVYQQQPIPTDVTGVPVTLTETDHNGNTYTIGTTTTDSSGTWAYNWTPPIPGNYTIVATFAGTNSYYGSCAETHIYANSPAPTAAPTASPPTGLATTSTVELGIAVAVIVIIIAIAIVGLLLLRKKP
jgi:hypothetical protein